MVQQSSLGLLASMRRFADTGLLAAKNRIELFAVEVREERARFIELFLWSTIALFLGIMAVIVLTATVVLICPADVRPYAAGGFTIVYAIGALWAYASVKARLKTRALPFEDTIKQLQKDHQWLDSLK